MIIAAVKFLNRNGTKTQRLATYNFGRMLSTDQPCPPQQTESSKPKEPCPPKVEPCPPPPAPASTCPEPQPCPSIPQCPPTICPPVLDSSNPCNFIPHPCPDPEEPNLTRLKKLQCLFQEENDIPIYLKKGNLDAFVYQSTNVLILVSIIGCAYNAIATAK